MLPRHSLLPNIGSHNDLAVVISAPKGKLTKTKQKQIAKMETELATLKKELAKVLGTSKL